MLFISRNPVLASAHGCQNRLPPGVVNISPVRLIRWSSSLRRRASLVQLDGGDGGGGPGDEPPRAEHEFLDDEPRAGVLLRRLQDAEREVPRRPDRGGQVEAEVKAAAAQQQPRCWGGAVGRA